MFFAALWLLPAKDDCEAKKGLIAAMFDILCEIEDINDCNPVLIRWVRQYNRILPYEIRKIGKDLGIERIEKAFAKDEPDVFQSEKLCIFNAMNPNLRGEVLPAQLPYYDEKGLCRKELESKFLPDEDRIKAKEEKLNAYYKTLAAEIRNAGAYKATYYEEERGTK